MTQLKRTIDEFLDALPEDLQHGARLMWDYLYPLSEPWLARLNIAYTLKQVNDSSGWESAGQDLWFALDRLHPGEMPPLNRRWTMKVVPWVTGGLVAAGDLPE